MMINTKTLSLRRKNMEAIRYLGKVLSDGHLSLPDDTAKQKGKMFEVILLPFNQIDIYSFTEKLADEKGFSKYTEKDIERIIHESRGLKD